MDTQSKILLTGGNGMVGRATLKLLISSGYNNLLTPSRNELDLRDKVAVINYFRQNQPDYVLMIAAKVGGIQANINDPFGFLSDNLLITQNLFSACLVHRPKKSLYLGSSCIYPRECPQPMKEEYLLTGSLEPTNEGYALSKIVGLRLAQYLHRQENLLTVCPMPCNLYGTGDHFDLEKAHVLSSLVKRFVDARDANASSVTVWGDGSARREFLHVDDMAKAILFFMESINTSEIINVGTGSDVSISELAKIISEASGYKGEILWDKSKPNGMPRKCLDVSKISVLGFKPQIGLEQGIAQTIQEYELIRKTAEI